MEVEAERSGPTVPWPNLPSITVDKIYSFLDLEDKRSMSQVCQNWYKEFSSPGVWREFTFVLPHVRYKLSIRPEVSILHKYAKYFRHIRIKAESKNFRFPIVGKELTLFLDFVSNNSQLLSISFIDIYTPCINWEYHNAKKIYFLPVLNKLLLKQEKLQSLELEDTCFSMPDAIGILQNISSKRSSTLKTLHLNRFLFAYNEVPQGLAIDVPLVIRMLMNLHTLTIDYTQYFEILVTWCYEHQAEIHFRRENNNLKKFLLICYGMYGAYRGIEPAAWKYFSKVFPELEVDMYTGEDLHTWNSSSSLEIIVRHMPLRALTIRFCESNLFDHQMSDSIFQYLIRCDINKGLETLILLSLCDDNELVYELMKFLPQCPKLRELRLELIRWLPLSLNVLFEHLIDSSVMALNTVHFTIQDVSSVKAASICRNLSKKYAPILEQQGLNLTIIASKKTKF